MNILMKKPSSSQASAWMCRDATYSLFHFLFKIKLYTGHSIHPNIIASFVRRYRSQYNTASGS